MINLEPLKINNINLSNIYYSNVKEKYNKKIILIKYINDNNKLIDFVFQTPTLTNNNKPIFNNDYVELEVLLESKYNNNINRFINFLDNLENKIKEDATHNVDKWFNKNNNMVVNFQKIIRDNNSIKIKILKNNDFETVLQMNNEQKINDYNLIPESSWCKMILECYSIWINSNNDFGLFFRPILISFTLKNIYNYKFIDDDEEEIIAHMPFTDIREPSMKSMSDMFISNNNNNISKSEYNELYNSLINNNNIQQLDDNNLNNEESENSNLNNNIMSSTSSLSMNDNNSSNSE